MLSPDIVLQQRYRIKRLLARGGMGAVYEAEAVHLGNATVAVKETFFSENWLQEQFQREAATLARLRHQALPKVTDHFSEGEGQFLVMEFIAGDDLGALLEQRLKVKDEPFEFRLVMEWADRLLDALSYIHGQYPPVIHRDIKPQNLKLTPRGELFLIDFGLAKDATTPTRPGYSLYGYTLEFAPPEQIKGEGTDARSDLYSLGATLYLLATGKTPPDARVRLESVVKHLMPDLLQPAHHVNPRIPFAFSAALAKSMALDREQRYQSALEMREALRQIERAIEAESAERERREAERRRLEEEERKRLEEEARWREEERKRLEEEARRREIERQRQIEEAERLKALQEELRRKEEELVKLRRALPNEAVTLPIVGQPDEAVTEQIVRGPVADGQRIDREEERKGREEETLQHEIESQRQREEAARRQTLLEEINRKKEELAELERTLQPGAATERIEQPVAGARQKIDAVVVHRRWRLVVGSLLAVSLLIYLIAKFGGSAEVKPPTQGGQQAGIVLEMGDEFTETARGLNLEIVRVPAGSFTMGSADNEPQRDPDEGPQHRVAVPGFYIGKYEVTQAQWRKVAGLPKVLVDLESDPANFRGDYLPVEQVSYWEAREFCMRLSRETGRDYRFPSEAEWEHAARVRTTTPFPFGSSLSSEQANFDGNYPYGGAPKGVYREKTMPVGSFAPNAFKLHDMYGNVWEWCEDYWHNDYNGAPIDGSAWFSGGDPNLRALRGGSWLSGGSYCRPAARSRVPPGDRRNYVGFRVAVSARK